MEARKKKLIRELMTKSSVRRETGLYVVDGPKMCGEIPEGETEELFVTEAFLKNAEGGTASLLHGSPHCTVIGESEMKQISDTVTPQGILAVVRRKPEMKLEELLSGAGPNPYLLLLETLQDPGNLGTIIRGGEAAGVSGIIMNRSCADLYAPKVIRSTMGSVFRMSFCIEEDLCRTADLLSSRGISCYAAHLEGSESLYETDLRGPSAVMIGNESRGLSRELTERAGKRIRIPMCGRVESLNAAMAAVIISFEAMRQRSL